MHNAQCACAERSGAKSSPRSFPSSRFHYPDPGFFIESRPGYKWVLVPLFPRRISASGGYYSQLCASPCEKRNFPESAWHADVFTTLRVSLYSLLQNPRNRRCSLPHGPVGKPVSLLCYLNLRLMRTLLLLLFLLTRSTCAAVFYPV